MLVKTLMRTKLITTQRMIKPANNIRGCRSTSGKVARYCSATTACAMALDHMAHIELYGELKSDESQKDFLKVH